MKLLLKGGRVVDPRSGLDRVADVLISGGVIERIGTDISHSEAGTVNVSDRVVAPGFIDLHVHLRDPGLTEKEDIRTGTMSAARGGVTTVVAMPNTRPVCDAPELVDYVARHPGACVNVLPAAAVTKQSKGVELTDFAALRDAGAVFLTDDGETVMDSRVMREAMIKARELDLPVVTHCEDKNLSRGAVMHDGETARRLGYRGMPSSAESVMVARDIMLAAETGCHLHITHVSVKESVELVRLAKRHGIHVTADVTPHNFSLTDERVAVAGSNAKMYPPLRTRADVDAICEGLADGTIDAIATDHAPHTPVEKAQGMEAAPKGVVGLETALAVAVTYLVLKKTLTIPEMIAKFTLAPADILRTGTGALQPGKPADVTVFNAGKEWVVQPAEFLSKGRNTPFEGFTLTGRPQMTIVRGSVRMHGGQVFCPAGQ
ncbi:MAG: dihydroorotase [Firmicutes bacterium]|nr:dihydroorotase [Bacillota bacterium]